MAQTKSGIKIVFIYLIVMVSCTQNTHKDGILDKNEMANIIIELQNAENLVSRMNLKKRDSSDVAFKYLENRVFKKFNTDSANYVNSFNLYASQSKDLIEIYEMAEKKLEKQKKDKEEKIKEKEALEREKADTLNKKFKKRILKSNN